MITVNLVANLATARPGNGDLVQTRGYSVVGTGGNTYRYNSTSAATVDNVLVINGPGSRGRYLAVDQEVVYATQAGALPDNPADSVAAIQSAVNALNAIGGGTLRFSKGTYSLIDTVTRNGLQTHIDMLDMENIRFEGDGARLKSDHIEGAGVAVNCFYCDGCRKIEWDGIDFESSYVRVGEPITVYGAGFINVAAISRPSWNLSIRNVLATNAYFIIRVLGVAPYTNRVRNIELENIYQDGGEYCLLFNEDGDNVSATGITTIGTRRTYFPYGCDNHYIEYTSVNNDDHSDVLIKAYVNDTTNIHTKGTAIGSTAPAAKVTIESQHPPATQPTPGKLRNITVELDDTQSAGESIRFAYYRDAVETATSAETLFDNIVIKGHVRNDFTCMVAQTPLGKANIDDLIIDAVAYPAVITEFWTKIGRPSITPPGDIILQNNHSVWVRSFDGSDYAGVISGSVADNLTIIANIANKALQLAAAGATGEIDFISNSAVQAIINDAGLDLAAGNRLTFGGGIGLRAGAGSPESAVIGSPGDIYLRTDGGAVTAAYIKETGSATNTGWLALVGSQSAAFTPTLQFGGAAVGMTGAFTGAYSRVGNSMTFTVNIELTAKGSSTGAAIIGGLPFAAALNTYPPVALLGFNGMAGITGATGGYISSLTTNIISTHQGATFADFLYDTNFTDTSHIRLSGSYVCTVP